MSHNLTEEQKAKIPAYINNWVEQYTQPLDISATERAVAGLYASQNLPMPVVKVFQSPRAAALAARADGLTASEISNSSYATTWWGSWHAWYQFAKEECGETFNEEQFQKFAEFVLNVHYIIAADNVAYISDKPKSLKFTKDKLHADMKPAVEYRDGYGLYVLNGVTVPKELVMTPASELTLDYYSKIKSADVKIEFIAKFGIDRMVSLGKVIDTYLNYKDHPYWNDLIFGKSEYKLIDMSQHLNGDRAAIYLSMIHQGNGSTCVECVGEGVKTIKQALDIRAGANMDDYVCESFH